MAVVHGTALGRVRAREGHREGEGLQGERLEEGDELMNNHHMAP